MDANQENNKTLDWVSLHTHTDYSLLDGMGKCKDYAARAKELGMKAIAITDHGTMSGAVDFYEACKDAGIKPLIGSEFYEAPESRFDKSTSPDKDKYNHIILIAKNQKGYENLCYLTTRANTEGFYAKPRIDFDLLKEHHEGLICLSGCIAGRIPKLILKGEMDEAINWANQYKELFGDDFYLEVQNHGLQEEQTVMMNMPTIANATGIKMVATNDCHYVRSEDAEAHEWLLCKQTGKTISDPDHMRYEGDYSLLSPEQMKEKIPFGNAVENTLEIVDKCEFEFQFAHDAKDYYMPEVHIPASYEQFGEDKYNQYMEDLVWEGFEQRYPEGNGLRQEAENRIKYELDIIKKMGFAEYFLDTRKTIVTSREHGIIVGPGRGSGAGSAVNYCLGITDLEPLKYGLLFERFLNPERVSMPDIDVDYEKIFKDDVIRREAESNGKDDGTGVYNKFAKIRTYGTLKAKQVIRDMASVAGLEQPEINQFAKLIPKNMTLKGYTKSKNGKTVEVEGAWETSPDLRAFVESDPKYQKVWDIALKLENTKKSASTHACGHIPTPKPCEELFPCSLDRNTGYLVCEYSMVEAEHLGLLKKDLLMLRNLAIVDFAHASIKAREDKDIPLWTDAILNDKEALKMISEGETYGVFQLESDAMAGCMKNLQPKSFEDVTAGVALYRPGPMDYIPQYIQNKNNPASIVYDDPRLKPILAPTYGVFVYQEQIMQTVQALAGFTKGEADMVRKAMGKKNEALMQKLGDQFREQAVEHGVKPEMAEQIWNKMSDFGKYAFNKSHAAAYSCISMQTAYLKCHYPIDFYAGLLSSEMDKKDLLIKHIKDCRDKGLEICPPDVNNSGVNFTAGDKKIFYGLNSISKVGQSVAESIVKEREQNGEFKSFSDFRQRMMNNGSNINSGAIKNLIYAGAFDWTGHNRPTLAENLESVDKLLKESVKNAPVEGQMSLFDMMDDESIAEEYSIENTVEEILDGNTRADFNTMDKLNAEKEASGFYISGHPMDTAVTYKSVTENTLVPFASVIDVTGKKAKMDFAQEMNDDEDMDDYGLDDEEVGMTTPVFEVDTSDDIEPKFEDKTPVIVQGIITEMREILTQKGQQMGFVTIEDADGNSLKVTCFPQLWIEGGVKQNMKEDDIITVLGEVSSYKGEFGLAARHIESEEQMSQAIYLKFPEHIPVTKETVQDVLNNTKQMIYATNAELRRKTPGVLHPIYMCLNDRQKAELGVNGRIMKFASCNIIEDLCPVFQHMFGDASVKVAGRLDKNVHVTEPPKEQKNPQKKIRKDTVVKE